MLYVFSGTDTIRVREKALSFARSCIGDGGEVVSITVQGYTQGILTEYAQSVSLFGVPRIIVLDTLSEQREIFAEVLEILPVLSESPHTFVLIEGALITSEKKRLTTYATRVEGIDAPKDEPFNTFALCDALLARDKKTLWVLLIQARYAGVSDEAIIGILFWQIKTLRLVVRTKSADEAQMKPFVYQKAKRALAVFRDGELDTFSRDLLRIYHDGHLGKCDMMLSLESWVLRI